MNGTDNLQIMVLVAVAVMMVVFGISLKRSPSGRVVCAIFFVLAAIGIVHNLAAR